MNSMSFMEQERCNKGLVYLHPEDKVDLTNTVFPFDTYCTAARCLHKPTRFVAQGKQTSYLAVE